MNTYESTKSQTENLNSLKSIFLKLKDGDQIFIHGAAATPRLLIEAMLEHTQNLKNIKIFHLHTEGPATYGRPSFQDRFQVRNLFVGANFRPLIDFNRIDYIPCFLSEMPNLFRRGLIKIDLAMMHTSQPDSFGVVSLGTSVDTALAAFQGARFKIAQVNRQMPFVLGDGVISLNQFDATIECDEPIYSARPANPSSEELQIGLHVASLVEDGSCLQMGIGNIPNGTLLGLKNHKHLGLHSEMCSDGVVDLIKTGVIDNSQKSLNPGKSVCSFIFGSKKLYDLVDHNSDFLLLEANYVNNPTNIAKQKKMISINSAVEVDLTGQVCADSVGSKIISGVGAQVDFIRGSSLSENGKPIIALTSRTKHGKSRIVSTLHHGAGVVTSRAHVHYIVTEYGIADLYAKSIGERAKALISIAHPEDREVLKRQFRIDYA